MQSRGKGSGLHTYWALARITVSMLDITDNSNYDETFMYHHQIIVHNGIFIQMSRNSRTSRLKWRDYM